MQILILAEKPKVAARLASVLSGNSAQTRRQGPVTIHSFTRDGDRYTIVPASGHLLSLDYPPKYNRPWTYPVILPIDGLVLRNVNKRSGQFLSAIRSAAKPAHTVVSACDLDTEGSAIAYEVFQHLGLVRKKTLKRMEYSALTAAELTRSFRSLVPFDWGRSYAGYTRAAQDLEWGANLTRALTLAGRRAGAMRGRRGKRGGVLSAGRVQSPTLALIVHREEVIERFVPETYYELVGTFEFKSDRFEAKYVERVTDRATALKIIDACLALGAGRANVVVRNRSVLPPPPFNGTDLQVEGARVLKVKPQTIADRRRGLAQALYEKGYISYPGTDSQKYPKTWKRPDFIAMLKIPTPLRKECAWVEARLRYPPREGKKDDPAHPTIHITGYGTMKRAKQRELYELIARRNLATLSPDALDQHTKITVEVDRYPFRATAKSTLDPGWRTVYPYTKVEESSLPSIPDGAMVRLVDIDLVEKETKPPPRFSISSLIKQLDKLGLGTKNTRGAIIEKLRDRGYIIIEKQLRPTPLGRKVVAVLEQFAPQFVDIKFTSQLERDMQQLVADHTRFEAVNARMLDQLQKVAEQFKMHEGAIGQRLAADEQPVDGHGRPAPGGRGGVPQTGRASNRDRIPIGKGRVHGSSDPRRTGSAVGRGRPASTSASASPSASTSASTSTSTSTSTSASASSPRTDGMTAKAKNTSTALGFCPRSGCAGQLVQRTAKRGRSGRFVGCSAYPSCRVTFSLVAGERVLKSICQCGLPIISGRITMRGGKKLRYHRCLGDCSHSELVCTVCSKPAQMRESKYGPFAVCPHCDAINTIADRKRGS